MESPVRNEGARLLALQWAAAERPPEPKRDRLLDTPPEQPLDDLAALAAQICGTPIALISIVGEDRQWFKANAGLPFVETSRAVSFCSYAIEQPDLCIVPDATLDDRFSHNLGVTGPAAYSAGQSWRSSSCNARRASWPRARRGCGS